MAIDRNCSRRENSLVIAATLSRGGRQFGLQIVTANRGYYHQASHTIRLTDDEALRYSILNRGDTAGTF